MIRRIVLRFKGKTPDQVKVQVKAIGGYWDDMLGGWSIGLEYVEMVKGLGKVTEVLLPKEHVMESAKERYMDIMYAEKIKRLIQAENALLKDIAIYDPRSAHHLYEVEPIKSNDLKYEVELSFYRRHLECKKLREEIKNLK